MAKEEDREEKKADLTEETTEGEETGEMTDVVAVASVVVVVVDDEHVIPSEARNRQWKNFKLNNIITRLYVTA